MAIRRGVPRGYIKKRKRFSHIRRGVPSGYRHIWRYNGVWDEKKIGRGKGWKVTFRASKGKRSRSYGSFGKGTKGAWLIRGIQYIKKTGKGRYQTVLKARKYPLRFYVRRGR